MTSRQRIFWIVFFLAFIVLAILCARSSMGQQQMFLTTKVAAAAAAWTPSSLGSSLKIWLANESLTTGDGVQTNVWADSSGNGCYATNALGGSTNAPYTTNMAAFNNKIVLYFNPATDPDYYTLPTAKAVFRNISSASVIACINLPNTDATKIMFQADRGTGSAGDLRASVVFTSNEYEYMGVRTQDTDSSDYSSTAPDRVRDAAFVCQSDFYFSTGMAVIYTNNAAVLSEYGFGTTNVTSDTDSIGVRIGNSAAGSGASFNGHIGEIAVVVPALSASDRLSFYTYLKTKFNVTGP